MNDLEMLNKLLSDHRLTHYQEVKTTQYQRMIENAIREKNDGLLEVIQTCHPFIFTPKKNGVQDIKEINKYFGVIDIPFKRICIEALNSPITSPTHENNLEEMAWITSVIVDEVSPRIYSFYAFVQANVKDFYGDIKRQELFVGPVNPGASLYGELCGIVHDYMQRLHSEKIGVSGREKPIKYKNKQGEKKFIRPKNITYVSPKKYLSKTETLISRNIEWCHRWEVRGHWRKINGIGKDRDGNYCVNNFTWITPFVKGPDNSPLIKKSRVVEEAV